jgi:hypothetical protein
MNDQTLRDLRRKAELAVADTSDPELKLKAFEVILTRLLATAEVESQATGASKQKPEKKPHGQPRTFVRTLKHGPRGPKALIEELIEDSFFKTQKTIAEVRSELINRAHHIPITSLSGPLQSLTREKKLRRQKAGTGGTESKAGFAYSNW